MGNKLICTNCQKSFNYGNISNCPECGNERIKMPHRFRPPKKDDTEKWKVVKFLIDNGFYYQHITDGGIDSDYYNRVRKYVEYPDNMRDAKIFVKKYAEMARTE
ncbi:hypothetical protein [Ulvibacter antarcticus]|uniref:Uncharacterized protein n=1 Tax=Ulvibacter antarcticus TaxID=442714 RepID=A0A3L9Y7A2_9FLAO|nr:hypothetical protein [Ulvibacter antarcticus]RMA56274.1 hypothetical protein BXY75_3395 [Ulvibacter antarcticus]